MLIDGTVGPAKTQENQAKFENLEALIKVGQQADTRQREFCWTTPYIDTRVETNKGRAGSLTGLKAHKDKKKIQPRHLWEVVIWNNKNKNKKTNQVGPKQ